VLRVPIADVLGALARDSRGTLVAFGSGARVVTAPELVELLRRDGLPWIGVRVRGSETVLHATLVRLALPAGYSVQLVADEH